MLSSIPSPIYFNIDSAWEEILYVYRFFFQFYFTITTYNSAKDVGGHLTAEPVVHTIQLIDFLSAYLVFTTVNDVVFWWNKSVNGELDDD